MTPLEIKAIQNAIKILETCNPFKLHQDLLEAKDKPLVTQNLLSNENHKIREVERWLDAILKSKQ